MSPIQAKLALAGALLLAGTTAALAHEEKVYSAPAIAPLSINPWYAASDTWFWTTLRVFRGCEGSPTVALRIKVPDQVAASIKPQMKPGWEITITKRKLDKPIDGPEGKITEVADEITWRGGPLPDDYIDDFALSMRAPLSLIRANIDLYFPTVQECQKGAISWVEIPPAKKAESEAAEESEEDEEQYEHPAPHVVVTPHT